jgi:RNA polymerase sigma factor (sigma-70 family)
VSNDAAHRAVDAVWRMESPRLIAGLARLVRDVGIAEELAHDALVIALEQWPRTGVPDNPGAWLMSAAKNRALDLLRRYKMMGRRHDDLGHELQADSDIGDAQGPADDPLDDCVGDDVLRLIFIACHPVLSTEARVALTLRLLCSLTTTEIARAYLVPEPTIAQRIVRAKRTLAEARVPFEMPRREELPGRLASVLDVIYLVFNEGYTATAGESWMRRTLCDEAVRLARILAELMPQEPEVHGLVSLLEIQSSRAEARIGLSGEPVLLLEQNRAQWDQLLIRRGLAALERAIALRGALLGTYTLQAAIASCHARARTAAETDWERIVALYDALSQVAPSPVVALNRAVAVAMAFGPAAGLELVDALSDERSMQKYHLLPSVRGDLLVKLGRMDEARTEFERAAALTRNEREREFLLKRAAGCRGA